MLEADTSNPEHIRSCGGVWRAFGGCILIGRERSHNRRSGKMRSYYVIKQMTCAPASNGKFGVEILAPADRIFMRQASKEFESVIAGWAANG